MNPAQKPAPFARLRLARVALQMFEGGQDTFEISKKLGVGESECVELIRMARGKVPEG